MSNVTASTTPATMFILAKPSVETTDLPDGWTWWDYGIRYEDGVWVDEQPDAARLLAHRPARWQRRVDAAELDGLTTRAVRDYRTGDSGLLNQLPPAHRSQALVELGYSAPGHSLLHTDDWPSGQAHTIGLPAFGGGRMIVGYDSQGGVRLSYDTPVDHPDVRQVEQEAWLTVPAGMVRAEDDQWGGIRFADPAERRVRAAVGTALPAGWALAEPRLSVDVCLDDLAATAPLGLDRETAVDRFVAHIGGPDTSLEFVVLRPTPTGWSYATGIGGYLRVRGERPDRQAAEVAGRTALRSVQEQAWDQARRRCGGRLDWTGWGELPPAAQVVVCERGESSYEALERIRTAAVS